MLTSGPAAPIAHHALYQLAGFSSLAGAAAPLGASSTLI
jgi:hypothetical protein